MISSLEYGSVTLFSYVDRIILENLTVAQLAKKWISLLI